MKKLAIAITSLLLITGCSSTPTITNTNNIKEHILKVVAKRTNITHFNDGTDTTMVHTNTTYYVTFEVESGDRMEMNVRGSEYGMLAEGDVGKLTFQGTRYLNFERC